ARLGRRRGGAPPCVDFWLAGSALALALIGAVLVYSATRSGQTGDGASPRAYLYRHLVNVGLAVALATLAARWDSRRLRLAGPVLYLAGGVGLVAVLLIGTTVNGARAWIRLPGGLQVQPAEFAKLGLVVGLAGWFVERGIGRRVGAVPPARDVLVALALCAVPLLLIMRQPDLGSAMVVAVAGFGVLLAAGVPARWLLGLVFVGAVVAVLSVRAGLLADYQLARFTSFTDPGRDLQGVSYNVHQAHIAMANGGLLGRGLFHGPQTAGGFVPEQQTDFVFSAAGEQFGFLGAAVIVGLYGLLLWRALRIAATADAAGRLVAVGVVCWFAFQVFENIGMNLGLTPVTGLPLPFVSYGGSSMFAGALAIGLLQAVRAGPDRSVAASRLPRPLRSR
ncbi:MAG: rod shape-determining protein RodA, partial [Actinomycetota bacterium]|nr:rod shape-determining protein RodA [Actinomycetota bacterium]